MMNETELFKEAVMNEDVERVRKFIEKEGLDVVLDDESRPIHYACENGHIDIVKLLIEMKCDLEYEDEWKWRPIHIALVNRHVDIVKLLIERKCDMECETELKRRPIHYACANGLIDIVKLLIEMKCDMECEDNKKQRPIHIALEKGHIDIVKLLIEMKCDMECEDADGRRPIHYASENGHIDIVKLLIEQECNINSEDRSNHHPIYWACLNGHSDIVELLRKENGVAGNETKKGNTVIENLELICRSVYDHTVVSTESVLTCLKNGQNMEEIGEGSFGIVYKVTESVTNRHFGLKQVWIDTDSEANNKNSENDTKVVSEENKNDEKAATKKKTNNANTAKNIENYINICLKNLKHKNIVTYFGSIEIDNKLNIFMEYMEGGSLKNYIDAKKDERLSNWKDYYDKIIEITKQILQGVSFLHRKEVIHQDIKPNNILFDRNKENIKISDFGVSRFCVQEFPTENPSFSVKQSQFSKRSTASYGTPGYTAPEIKKTKNYTFSADIWSVGATVRHMLTGNIPSEFSDNFKIHKPEALYLLMNRMVNIEPYERPKAYELLHEKIFMGHNSDALDSMSDNDELY